MKSSIRCRVAACREVLDDGKQWSFYLINDSADPLDSAVLCAVGSEWGDFGNSEVTDVRVTALAPGAAALIWRDDGSGVEFRMDFTVRVRAGDREARLRFEFPKLYRMKDMPVVSGLGKRGWEVTVEA